MRADGAVSAVFFTRGHPTARFLNRMSAVFTPIEASRNAPPLEVLVRAVLGRLGRNMACCILGPPTLSTYPASMCSLRATWADEACSSAVLDLFFLAKIMRKNAICIAFAMQ